MAPDFITSTSVSIDASLSRLLWMLILVMASAVMVSFALLGLRIDLFSNLILLSASAGYVALVCYYGRVRREFMLASAMTTVGQLFLVLFTGVLLTYAASAVEFPFRDAELLAIDQWLGFDRAAFRHVVDSVTGLSAILDLAYMTIQPQTALIPFVLIISGKLARLQRFVLAFGLALCATSAIAVFIPAIDAAIYVDLAPLRQAAIPAGVYTHLPTLESLRSGAMSTIRLDDLEGLVTFPSFHTANAILFAWALWTVRYLRYLGVAVNALMIASTPLTGSHYVIDLIGGGAVAIGAILMSGWMVARAVKNCKPYEVGRPCDVYPNRPAEEPAAG